MARTPQQRADIEALQRLVLATDGIVDYTYLIAYIMRKSGCTHAEIGKVLGMARQNVERLVTQVEKVLG